MVTISSPVTLRHCHRNTSTVSLSLASSDSALPPPHLSWPGGRREREGRANQSMPLISSSPCHSQRLGNASGSRQTKTRRYIKETGNRKRTQNSTGHRSNNKRQSIRNKFEMGLTTNRKKNICNKKYFHLERKKKEKRKKNPRPPKFPQKQQTNLHQKGNPQTIC